MLEIMLECDYNDTSAGVPEEAKGVYRHSWFKEEKTMSMIEKVRAEMAAAMKNKLVGETLA